MKEMFGRLIRRISGKCPADGSDLLESVELSHNLIDIALTVGELHKQDSRVFSNLTKANEGMGKIGESLTMVNDICLDVVAINKVNEALDTLGDGSIIRNDPVAAGEAFDSLFQGFGRLCRYLPPPANAWQQFFESFNLFKPWAEFNRAYHKRIPNPRDLAVGH